MDPRTSVIRKRIGHINQVIAVASGKGGVGKSLVASGLALKLAQAGKGVGLLDLDVYGPSTHIILGIHPVDFPEEEQGIIPPNFLGIRFMSIVLFSGDKPGAFRGIDVTNMIIELLAITRWPDLDFLIIDLPPGIGDETLDVIHLVKPDEFLVVTTPSKVAMGAVAKLLGILRELDLPVIGVLENMKMTESDFIEQTVESMGISYLGSIEFDHKLEDALGNTDLLLKTTFLKELKANLII